MLNLDLEISFSNFDIMFLAIQESLCFQVRAFADQRTCHAWMVMASSRFLRCLNETLMRSVRVLIIFQIMYNYAYPKNNGREQKILDANLVDYLVLISGGGLLI